MCYTDAQYLSTKYPKSYKCSGCSTWDNKVSDNFRYFRKCRYLRNTSELLAIVNDVDVQIICKLLMRKQVVSVDHLIYAYMFGPYLGATHSNKQHKGWEIDLKGRLNEQRSINLNTLFLLKIKCGWLDILKNWILPLLSNLLLLAARKEKTQSRGRKRKY